MFSKRVSEFNGLSFQYDAGRANSVGQEGAITSEILCVQVCVAGHIINLLGKFRQTKPEKLILIRLPLLGSFIL